LVKNTISAEKQVKFFKTFYISSDYVEESAGYKYQLRRFATFIL